MLVMSCVACNSVPTVSGCSSLAQDLLTTPTAHATLEDSGDAALDWQRYGLAETGALNQANDRAETGYNIIHQCEQRDETIRQSHRPWW